MVATTLSQSILAGMDPSTYRNIQDIQNGEDYLKTGMDASPTTKWGAVGRLANALAGSYIQNQSTSDLAKSVAAGKRSAQDQLLAAIQAQQPKPSPPLSPPTIPHPNTQPDVSDASPFPSSTQQTLPPVTPNAPEAGTPNAAVANRTPGAPAFMQTAQYQAPSPEPQFASDGNTAIAAINAATQPRGIRNNNALNIEDGPFARSQPGYVGTDGRFAKFQTPEHGAAAASALLDSYDNKGVNSVNGIVNRWAPASDGNNTMAYAADVATKLGIDPNAPVPPEKRQALIEAMAQHENGRPVKFASATPTTANDADPEVHAVGQKVAEAHPDIQRLLAVMTHPYADDATKALASKLILQQLEPKEDEFASSPQGIFNKRTGDLKAGTGISGNDYGGLQGKDLLAAVQKSNPAVASQVTAIIEGRAPYPSGSRLNPVQQQVKELVTQVDPTFEVGNSGARIKVRNEFNSGGPNSPAGAITAGNTAIQHLGHLSDEAEKLGNFDSGIPGNNLVNSAKNAIAKSAGGGIASSNFDSIRNKYIEEATKFYRGTGGNESDLQRDIAALNSAQSPSQLHDVIKTQADLMQSKINALQERWKHGMGPLVEDFPIIQPESQKAIDAINKRQSGVKDESAPTAPAAPHQISSEAEYDAMPSGTPYVAPDGSMRTKK